MKSASEASLLTGIAVSTVDDARRAGDVFLVKGVGCALIALGEAKELLYGKKGSQLIPACHVGAVVETTGTGDAFNSAFAAALAAGASADKSARFDCAAAGI